MRDIEMRPVGDGLVCLHRTVVRGYTLLHLVFDPPLRTMLLAIRHEPHSRLHAMREEFGDAGLGGELDSSGQRRRLCHLREVLLHRHVCAEMKVVLQFVAVDVPHTVEITGGEPVGVEDLLGFRTTDTIQEKAFELIVRQPVLGTRTDVIVVIPELCRHFGTAYAFQEPTAVLYRSPL